MTGKRHTHEPYHRIGEVMRSRFDSAERTGRLPPMGSAALFLAAPLGACDEAAEVPASAAPAPPPAVTVISAQPTEVTPGFSFNGRVVAVEKVQLRARVTGFLDQRPCAEGSEVEQGDSLVDGQFAGVRVERSAPELVLVVPEALVRADHTGPYVLVVGAHDKVAARHVALGDETDAQVVIREGLQQGERVIVEGLRKVRPRHGGRGEQGRGDAGRPDGFAAALRSTGPPGSCANPGGVGCSDEPLAMRERGARLRHDGKGMRERP